MPTTRIRLTAVETHPIQYNTPWFRYITAAAATIDLTVLYVSRPTAAQQGVGFETPFKWDTSLLDGHRWTLLRDEIPDGNFSADVFRGIDAREIGAAVLATRPDVVLVPGWHSVSLVRALVACRRRRIPLLYRGDTHLGLAPRGWRRPAWRLKTRVLLGFYSAYLAVGRRSREYLEAHGVPPTSIFASPHVVDNAWFAASAAPHLTPEARARVRAELGCAPDEFVVLFVGKLNGRKRVRDTIDAVANLGSKTRLVVAGAGTSEMELRAVAEQRGIRASWLGFVNQSALARVYAAADCLTLPSAEESWGLVVNEALASGLPVVVADTVGCAPDLVLEGRSGATFRAGDVADFSAALARVRDAGGRALGRTCREVVGAHSLERATAGLVAACEAVHGGQTKNRIIACCGGMVIVAGLERMTFEVLRVARERGDRVHCIVNGWENHRIVPLAEEIGATWSTGFYGHAFTRRPRLGAAFRMLIDVVRTSAGLLRTSMRLRPTHVLVPDYLTVIRNIFALPVLRVAGATVVMRLGNAPEPGRFYRFLWRWLVDPFVDRFVCNSAFTERELLKHGVPEGKVAMVYNTAPRRRPVPSATRPTRDPHRIVYVGQIIPEKGLDILFDAVGILIARGTPATLDVVGAIDGWIAPAYEGFRDGLLQRAASPDLAGRVRFLGWREDVSEILHGGAVHCCPSHPRQREAFGVVILEAKLAGVPSVVTPVGALPELVEHRVDGWVAADATATALADGLQYFLDNPGAAERAGEAALASVARFARDSFQNEWRKALA